MIRIYFEGKSAEFLNIDDEIIWITAFAEQKSMELLQHILSEALQKTRNKNQPLSCT
jgi:hypothetical protein